MSFKSHYAADIPGKHTIDIQMYVSISTISLASTNDKYLSLKTNDFQFSSRF